jgi:OFA family oxalate/formate antiporter-like MFS transporter
VAPTTRAWIVALAAFAANVVLGAAFVWSSAPKGALGGASIPLTWSLCATAAGFAVVMPFGGALQDSYGPRSAATLGAFLVGLGLLAGIETPVSQMLSARPALTTLGFGLLAGSGVALVYAAATPCAAKWFAPKHRGLVCGIVVGGLASGWLAAISSLSGFTRFLGSTFGHVALGLGCFIALAGFAQFLSPPPLGLVPPYAFEGAPLATGPIMRPLSLTWIQAAQSSAFALMWLSLALGASATIAAMFVSARVGAASGTALTVPGPVVAAALGNVVGRPVVGLASDLLGRRIAVALSLALTAFSFLWLAIAGVGNAELPALVVGAGYGGLLAVFPALTYDFFGTTHAGADYGLLFTAWGVGGGAAVLLSRTPVASQAGAVSALFALACAACLLGGGLVLLARRPDGASFARARSSDAAARA